jgi:hypothetical protein
MGALKKPTSNATKWRESKLAQGLCGYCGDKPIAYPRSRIRCKDCLEANNDAKEKYQTTHFKEILLNR